MFFTQEDIQFINKTIEQTKAWMHDVFRGVHIEVPPETTEKLMNLYSTCRGVKLDSPTDIKMHEEIVTAMQNIQIIVIENSKHPVKKANPSKSITFHNVHDLHEADKTQIIKMKHRPTVISLSHKTCDTFVRGMQSAGQGIQTTGDFIVAGGKKTGKVIGKGIVAGGKKTGKGAVFAGKGVAAGAALVVGGVAYGANAAWEHVLEPAGKAIADVIDQAITAMQDAVRKENINDADKAIRNVVEQAQLVIDNSLQAIQTSLHIIDPSLSVRDLVLRAKNFIGYENIEQSLKTIMDNVIRLKEDVSSSDQVKEYINLFDEKFTDLQEKVEFVLEAADSYVDDASKQLENNRTSEQTNGWLLDDLKDCQSLSKLKEFINTLNSSKDSSDYAASFQEIGDILAQVQRLCENKNLKDDAEKFGQIIDDLNSITNSSDDEQVVLADLSEADIINLKKKLNEAVDNIAEFDRSQYVLENQDKFDQVLGIAKSFLNQANNAKENMIKPLKKARNALKAADSFAAGVLRLGEKGLNYVLSNIKDTINSIWDLTSKFITSMPGLAKEAAKGLANGVVVLAKAAVDKLLDFTDAVTSKISELSDKFVQSMRKIIGLRTGQENKDSIYQKHAFRPEKIRKVILENLAREDQENGGIAKDIIIAPNPDKKNPYPYTVTTKLKCYSHPGNKEKWYDVILMTVNKDTIHFEPPLDMNEFAHKTRYMVPPEEKCKFDEANLKLLQILGNDPRGLLSAPRAADESIKLKRFNDQTLDAFLNTRVMRHNARKINMQDTSVSEAVLRKFEDTKKALLEPTAAVVSPLLPPFRRIAR